MGPRASRVLRAYGLGKLILGINHDRDAVLGYRKLDKLDAVLLAGLGLLGVDRPGCVRDLGLPVAESFEAVAGAGPANGNIDVRVSLVKALCRRLRYRQYSAGAFDGDLTLDPGTAFPLFLLYLLIFLFAAAATG